MTNPVKILLGNLKTILSFGSSNANKNVVTDANGDLKVEDKNNHSHGNISSTGTLNETSKNVVTDSNGNITTEAKLIGSSTATDIKMNGTQSAGSSSNYAKADHVHPSDTSKVDKVSGKGLSTNDFTDSYKNSLDSINNSYPNALNQIAYLTANKLEKKQTDYKGKNVVVHSTSGEITFEDKNNHNHNVNDINGLSSIATSGSYDDLSNIPSIVEEFSFYWVDDYLDYLSEHSISFSYDPNTDIVNLVNYLNNKSIDFETNKLYKIAYGSSYNHDIYVAFIDDGNGGYTPLYVATTERYVTQYELSTHTHNNYLTSSDISGKADITQSITNGDTTHSPSADIIYDTLIDSNSTTKNGHTHDNYLTSSDISGKADITQSIVKNDTTHSPSGHVIYNALMSSGSTIKNGHSHSFNDLTNKPSTTAITINYVGGGSTTLNVYHS